MRKEEKVEHDTGVKQNQLYGGMSKVREKGTTVNYKMDDKGVIEGKGMKKDQEN